MEGEYLYKTRCHNLVENYCKKASDYAILNNYEFFKDIITDEEFKEIIKSKNRRRAKRSRCNKKLKQILLLMEDMRYNDLDSKLLWVTCTFNDEELKLKEETRTKKLNRWIKKNFIIALANIDYGSTTEREHHHFIGLTRHEIEPALKMDGKQAKTRQGSPLFELKDKNYTLGHEPDIEVITRSDDDYSLKKISNYLVKLQNHAMKETTKKRRIRLLF